jgi:outer membrane protein OmpA-like peptidoglycan-associated protein
MKTLSFAVSVSLASILGGCAATVPLELVNARQAYQNASNGPASQVALAELHVARQALASAEQSFNDAPDSYLTRDLAYVAQRKSELATATASIKNQQKTEAQAKTDFQTAQGQIVEDTKADLKQSEKALAASQQSGVATAVALAASERSGKLSAEQLTAEQAARAAADKRAADSQAALAKLGSIKEEPRGMVITLSGSVLFASNQAALLPEARNRVDQVVAVLLSTRERNVLIEGHTDSQGSDANNLELSQRRADAVREYIVSKGYQGDLVRASGLGEGRPIASNTSAEGRANNRRVEVVIAPEVHASSR